LGSIIEKAYNALIFVMLQQKDYISKIRSHDYSWYQFISKNGLELTHYRVLFLDTLWNSLTLEKDIEYFIETSHKYADVGDFNEEIFHLVYITNDGIAGNVDDVFNEIKKEKMVNNQHLKLHILKKDDVQNGEALQTIFGWANHERSLFEQQLLENDFQFSRPIPVEEEQERFQQYMMLKNLQDRKPIITYILMGIQVLVFLLMELQGGSQDTYNLIRFGAKYNPYILQGEWWRFFTPIFIHIGLLHLAMNTYALHYIGKYAEKLFGHGRFLIIYLFSGFLGSVVSFLVSTSLSAGASGAIFGCMGALLFLGIKKNNIFSKQLLTSMLPIILLNLVLGFSISSIDNGGHLGGLLGGFLAASIVQLPFNRQKNYRKQFGMLILTICITIGLLYFGYSINAERLLFN
jgi:rhomboid protease GluP